MRIVLLLEEEAVTQTLQMRKSYFNHRGKEHIIFSVLAIEFLQNLSIILSKA